MKTIVTGGAGFVAANLIARLLRAGHEVIVLDNFCRGSMRNLEPLRHQPALVVRQVDLSDLAAYRDALGGVVAPGTVREVWHLAANSDIPAGTADPHIDFRDTFLTTYNTLAIMEELRAVRLCFASSSAIYGDHGDAVLSESSGPLFPVSNYGAMKLASEAAICAAAERFLHSAVLFRFPNVVGVPATHGVILDLIRKLRTDPTTLPVLGDGTQRKSYLHVSDLVDAMLLVREKTQEKPCAINIGPIDDGVTVSQIATEVVRAVAPEAAIRFGTGNRGWLGDVPRFAYSVEKLLAFGWWPQHGSLAAVRLAIAEIAQQEGMSCVRQ